MAKTTKAAGPTFTPEELSDQDPPARVRIKRAELGVVDQWQMDGTDSSAQSNKSGRSDKKVSGQGHPPALTTENPSLSMGTDSSALTTDGNGPETVTDEDEVPPYIQWNKDELKEECRKRELPVSGTIADLVERLEEYDAASVEE